MTSSILTFSRNHVLNYYDQVKDELLESDFRYIGNGCNRTVYIRKNVVIKIPLHSYGLCDNIKEAYCYKKYRNNPGPNGEVYAPCRLLPNGCLMMVYVKYIPYGDDLPDWTRWIDCGQCGSYKGRIVAYDSATDVTVEDRDEARMWEETLQKKYNRNIEC